MTKSEEKILMAAVDTAVESILNVKSMGVDAIYPVLLDTIEHVFSELVKLDEDFHPINIIGPLFDNMDELAFPMYIALGKGLSSNSEYFKEALDSNFRSILNSFRDDDAEEDEDENFEGDLEDISSKENLLIEMKEKIGRVLDILFSSGHPEQDASNLVSAFASGAKTLEYRTEGYINIPKLIAPLLLATGNPYETLKELENITLEMINNDSDMSVEVVRFSNESEVC